MYESFYNFKAEPFRLSPDHRFCFTHKSYAKAKAYMQYAIHRAEGFVMVTGKPGTGKTTLVNDLVDGLSQSRIVVATIVSTQLEADDLLRLVSCNFGLDVDAPNKAVVLQGLSVRLKRHHEEGTRALLIIDEAQDLSASALEELRLLTNLQLNNQPLLQIFLVGQENLRDLVQKPSMEQVHQRLVAACHLDSLNEEDTKAYVRHRLDRVGWKDDPIIDEGVYPLVYQFSKGVPRRINLICSRFLLHGSVEEKHRIRASDVRTVVEELQHEQLAPVGFKGQLPPLLDDEEDEVDPQPAGSADSVVTLVTEDSAEQNGRSGGGQDAEEQETIAEQEHDGLPEAQERAGVDEDSLRVVSLEAEVRREENSSPGKSDSGSEDVIQQNYFSLDDAMDGPSEPVPIQNPSPAPAEGHGYGDRFANAQRQARQSTTRYYSEYQADGSARLAGNRKRSVLGLAFLFALILGVVLIAIYMIRPQILQGEISYLEERISGYLEAVQADDQVPGKEGSDSTGQDRDAIRGEATGEVSTQSEQKPAANIPQPARQTEPVARHRSQQDEAPVDALSVDTSNTAADPALASRLSTTAPDLSSQITGLETFEEADGIRSIERTEPFLSATTAEPPAAKKKVSPTPAASPEPRRVEEVTSPEDRVQLPSAPAPESMPQDTQEGEPSLAAPLNEEESATTAGGAVADIDAASNDGSLDSSPVSAGGFPEPSQPASSDAETAILQEPGPEREKEAFRTQATVQTSAPERSPALQKKTSDSPVSSDEVSSLRLFFDSDSSEISLSGRRKLDRVVNRLGDDPDAVAHIVGYADSTGDPAYNLALSFKRARVVADYLRSRRISTERLRVEGRGVHSGPIEEETTGSRSGQSHRLVTVDLLQAGE